MEGFMDQNDNQFIQIYSKDSFDRFGDDLCELLLSYLTINQKICFESVCKQWQRLVFNKQQKVKFSVINHFNNNENLTIDNNINSDYEIRLFERDLLLRLEFVLKKFININEIQFTGSDFEMNGRALELITNYCQYLKKLTINKASFDDISHETLLNFGVKFGLRFKTICISNSHQLHSIYSLIEFLPNVYTINFPFIETIAHENGFYPELRELYLINNIRNDINIKALSQKFNKQLKIIHIKLDNNRFNINNSLKLLSTFINLNELSLRIDINNEMIETLNSSLILIANECKFIKSLRLEVFIKKDVIASVITGQWLQILGHFRALTKLRFALWIDNYVFMPKNFLNQYFGSVDSLKGCKNLKHLFLVLKHINDYVFEDIDKYLPQLMTFRLVSQHCVITDLSLYYLSKHQNLSLIQVIEPKYMGKNTFMCDISDDGVCHLIMNSSNLRSFELNCYSRITMTSIQAFISRAKVYTKELKFQFKNSYLQSYLKDIPQNLDLKVIADNNDANKDFNDYVI